MDMYKKLKIKLTGTKVIQTPIKAQIKYDYDYI